MKKYSLGMVVGRFQTFHHGHEQMIRYALDQCETIIIMIGSAQESNNQKNPFDYEFRHNILSTIFQQEIQEGKIFLAPLTDLGVGNNTTWGDHLINIVIKTCGRRPDAMISGEEERRTKWFRAKHGPIEQVYVPKTINISATAMREHMLNNNRESWQEFTNPKIWPMYDVMRQLLIAAQANTETMSR